MHLTNYSVNKHNENFERDETVDKGSKRSISWFTEFLRTNDYDVAKFWGDVSVRGLPTQTDTNTVTCRYIGADVCFHKSKDDNKTLHKCKQHRYTSVKCNLLMYSHIYTFSYYQPTHAAHKTQTYQQRLDMICNDSNSVSFRALFNSRKSSVKTSFLEGELYLALLSAHPNTFTLFLFFHQSLLGRFFYLLYLINFHPSHYMPNHSYSFLFYPFLSSGSVYALLYFILYLYFFFTLAFCPSVRSHLGCMVPEYLYCLFSCYQHSTSQSNPIGYCTFLKAVFYLFFHFSLFILNKVAFETIVAAEESLYYIYYLHIYLLQQIRI